MKDYSGFAYEDQTAPEYGEWDNSAGQGGTDAEAWHNSSGTCEVTPNDLTSSIQWGWDFDDVCQLGSIIVTKGFLRHKPNDKGDATKEDMAAARFHMENTSFSDTNWPMPQ
jgi:hypothetical protein